MCRARNHRGDLKRQVSQDRHQPETRGPDTHVGEYVGEVGVHFGEDAEYGALVGEVGELKEGDVGE